MAKILHKIRIESSIDDVYAAITTVEGLCKWYSKWTTFAEGDGEVGSVIRFGFGEDKYESKFEVIRLEENKKVEWKCIDEPGEWSFNGTNVKFDLSEEVVEMYDNKKMVVIDFTHSGFKKAEGFFREVNSRWAYFLLSLKFYIEDGKGNPVPDDIFM